MENLYKFSDILEHIEKVYKLEVVPCSIPRNNFQYLKRNFYIWVKNKISEKLFYFLRDKVSPIKYLDERPGKEIWFYKRNSEYKVSIEIEVKPVPPESCIYSSRRNDSGLFIISGENYMVEIYTHSHTHSHTENISFPLNKWNGKEQIDYYFSKVDELKTELRNYKLNEIL